MQMTPTWTFRQDDSLGDIEARLQNWARLVRVYPHRAMSMTGIACEILRKHGREENRPPVYDPDAVVKPAPIDERDGWRLEKEWAQLPEKQKRILKNVYIVRLHPDRLCRSLGINHRDFDMELRRAQVMMRNRVGLFA